jgi:hypothetical protein
MLGRASRLKGSTTTASQSVALRSRHIRKGGRAQATIRSMNRGEWLRSGLLIVVLLVLAILVAQSRRNCEIPGSAWVPCIWGEPLKHQPQ